MKKKKLPNSQAGQFRSWSLLPESNRRPHPYHGCALPTELKRRYSIACQSYRVNIYLSKHQFYCLSEALSEQAIW
jgi:hypothetical protein